VSQGRSSCRYVSNTVMKRLCSLSVGSFSIRRVPVNFSAATVLGVCSLHILWVGLYVTSECKRILELPEITSIVLITTLEGFRRS
jgi:hypothetical protein